MTTAANPPDHTHAFNFHTGRPRFHFDEGGGDGGAAAAAAAAAAATAATASKPWHEGVAPEVLGFWQNKGLPLDSPKDFGLKLTELYKGAEKFIGVPPDQVIKIPKSDAPPEDIRAYYERLGAPKEAKDYDLSAVKDAGIAEAMRASMHERGVSKDAANAIAKSVATALESKSTTDTTELAATLQAQKDALAKNWGDKFQYNHLQAIEGARRLGIDKDGVAALEKTIGYDKVMEAMRKIGAHTREDTFVERGAGGPVGDVTTREGAQARKNELMADKAWVEKYNSGDPAAKREMTRLNQMITGVTS
jgi:hypothetical protein